MRNKANNRVEISLIFNGNAQWSAFGTNLRQSSQDTGRSSESSIHGTLAFGGGAPH